MMPSSKADHDVEQQAPAKDSAAFPVTHAEAAAAPAVSLERVNVVLPRQLRRDVGRRLLDLDRRVSFSGFVEAALREALAGDPAELVNRWNARARRRDVNATCELALASDANRA